MNIVIIDNYDSFTYNLSHQLKALGAQVDVVRNDAFQMSRLEPYDKIVLSPGPGVPEEAGLLNDVIRRYAGRKPYWASVWAIRPLPRCSADGSKTCEPCTTAYRHLPTSSTTTTCLSTCPKP